jgi:hypothetical protein
MRIRRHPVREGRAAEVKRRRVLEATVALAASPLACTAPAVARPPQPPPRPAPTPPPIPAAPAPAIEATATAEPAAAPRKAAYERVVTRIGQNHGHVLQVTLADVSAGAAKTYDLTGTAGHAHAVTLEPAVFERLRAGEVVRLPSTRDGHLHRLLVRLAPAVDPPEAANVCEIKIGGKDDHELFITAADMKTRADKVYDIQGVAPHTHAVRIRSADFERLARGEQVAVNSSYASPGEDHFHVVFVRYPHTWG